MSDQEFKEILCPATLRDLCDEAKALLQCLSLVVDNKEFQLYIDKPHHYLIDVISKNIETVEKGVKEL